jgi:hypothetical protein
MQKYNEDIDKLRDDSSELNKFFKEKLEFN